MKKIFTVLVLSGLAGAVLGHSWAAMGQEKSEKSNPSRLAVIWSSGDPEVAHKVCFMYTHNAKRAGWFDEVTLIVWGPSAKLLAGDEGLQVEIKAMLKDGVRIQACQACSDSYHASDRLRSLGIEVKYMGKPLTDMIQGGWKVLTF